MNQTIKLTKTYLEKDVCYSVENRQESGDGTNRRKRIVITFLGTKVNEINKVM